jgi:hypothetical protein
MCDFYSYDRVTVPVGAFVPLSVLETGDREVDVEGDGLARHAVRCCGWQVDRDTDGGIPIRLDTFKGWRAGCQGDVDRAPVPDFATDGDLELQPVLRIAEQGVWQAVCTDGWQKSPGCWQEVDRPRPAIDEEQGPLIPLVGADCDGCRGAGTGATRARG